MKTLSTLIFGLLSITHAHAQIGLPERNYDFLKFYEGEQAEAYFKRLATAVPAGAQAGACAGTLSLRGWVYPVGFSDLFDSILHRPDPIQPQQQQSRQGQEEVRRQQQPQQQTQSRQGHQVQEQQPQQQQRSGNPVVIDWAARARQDAYQRAQQILQEQQQADQQGQQQLQPQSRQGNQPQQWQSRQGQIQTEQQPQSRQQVQQAGPYQILARCSQDAKAQFHCVVALGKYSDPSEGSRMKAEFNKFPEVAAFEKCF